VALLIGVGLAGCLLLVLLNPSNVASVGGEACVGFVITPRLQVGVAWYSPLSSYLPPLTHSRYALCVRIPPSLAPRALFYEWMFPP